MTFYGGTIQIVLRALLESVEREAPVTIEVDDMQADNVRRVLRSFCADSRDDDGEYWGRTADGDDWRIRVNEVERAQDKAEMTDQPRTTA